MMDRQAKKHVTFFLLFGAAGLAVLYLLPCDGENGVAEKPPRLLNLPTDVMPVAFHAPPVPNAKTANPPLEPINDVILRLPVPLEEKETKTPPVDDIGPIEGSGSTPEFPPVRELRTNTIQRLPPVAIPQAPVAPVPEPTYTYTKSPNDQLALESVSQRATEHARHGFALAERGAFFSARAEFIQSLRVLSQTLDASGATRRHGDALAAGLRALKEADDFVPRGSRLEADIDVRHLVAAHRTPVLKDRDNQPTALVALQLYYTFAQEKLSTAGGQSQAASFALYGMGKLQLAIAGDEQSLAGPKAMALYQAALVADPGNYMAANELGVLLARYGQWQQARSVLRHGISVHPIRDSWQNLAVVHQQLGEHELAQLARAELNRSRLSQNGQQPANVAPMVRWTDAETFARMDQSGAPVAPPIRPVVPRTANENRSWFPWRQSSR